MDLILTEARFSVVNRVRNGVLFSNLDGLLILISCEHGKNSHKSAQCTADYGWRDKDIWKAAECLHVTFGPCSRAQFCSVALGLLEEIPTWGCQRDLGSTVLLPKSLSPALCVFCMCHDNPLPPQSVWFSQKQEDLPGHWRNVKGLTADYFFLSILTGRVGWIFILCCPKGWAPFSSQKASLQLTRAIFRLQCPTSDFWSKDIYIHLCV